MGWRLDQLHALNSIERTEIATNFSKTEAQGQALRDAGEVRRDGPSRQAYPRGRGAVPASPDGLEGRRERRPTRPSPLEQAREALPPPPHPEGRRPQRPRRETSERVSREGADLPVLAFRPPPRAAALSELPLLGAAYAGSSRREHRFRWYFAGPLAFGRFALSRFAPPSVSSRGPALLFEGGWSVKGIFFRLAGRSPHRQTASLHSEPDRRSALIPSPLYMPRYRRGVKGVSQILRRARTAARGQSCQSGGWCAFGVEGSV